MSNKFNRSDFMKERHELARLRYDRFKDLSGDNKKGNSYHDFLKEDHPLKDQVITYEVSYQVSYRGSTDSILVSPQTFLVIGFKGQESEVQKRTMNMILDSKGKSTGTNFHPNSLQALEGSTQINILPRGMEDSQRKPTKTQLKQLYEQGYVVSQLDNTLKFKNKKQREGFMNLDIRHFID